MRDIAIPLESQRRLLQLSRRTLEDFVRGTGQRTDAIADPYLQTIRHGVFVSLHAVDELRGCIGSCTPERCLAETVIEMTEAAASRDPRMEPVRPEELAAIRIDISILSVLERAEDPLALEVGRHGLYVSSGGHRGVLLPQVAAEHGWDMQTFLEQSCRKAGLQQSAWKDPATMISSFTALVIGEDR
jgi:AmmeMemoRadiSam system protein A